MTDLSPESRLYAYAYVSLRSEPNGNFTTTVARSGAGYCLARSREEALGTAWTKALSHLPASERWDAPNVTVLPIEDATVLAAAAMLAAAAPREEGRDA